VRIDRADDSDERPCTADASGVRGADAAWNTSPDRDLTGKDADHGTEAGSADRVARFLEYRATVDAVNRAYAIDQGCAGTGGGVLRRVEDDDDEYDEEFGRDLAWTRSWVLYSYERGNGDNQLYEISTGEAGYA
jgi:hypothetical protein